MYLMASSSQSGFIATIERGEKESWDVRNARGEESLSQGHNITDKHLCE